MNNKMEDKIVFSERLRLETSQLHREAERTGFIAQLLKKQGTAFGYALLLTNLLPVYEVLEAGLDRHSEAPVLRGMARAEIYRSSALRSDLGILLSRIDRAALPLLPAGRHYRDRIAAAAEGDGTLLIAHAYVRYFGDLSGGQILSGLLSPLLSPQELSFYAFASISNLEAFKEDYRKALDLAVAKLTTAEQRAILNEAQNAFKSNIALSLDVQSYLHRDSRI